LIAADVENRNITLKATLINVAVLLTAMIFSAAIIELGARTLVKLPSRPGVSLFSPDEKYIFRLNPGAEFSHEFDIGPRMTRTVKGRISDQGLRDEIVPPKGDDEFRVILIGDSHTFGVTVEFDQTIGMQLQSILQSKAPGKTIRVINLGVGGTGPWQQRGRLLDIGFGFEPDVVVHQLFTSNDIGNSLTKVGARLESYEAEWEYSIILWRMPAPRRFRVEAALQKSAAYSALRSAIGRERVLAFWAEGIRALPRIDRPRKPISLARPSTLEVDLDVWYPNLEKGWGIFMDDVLATARDCAERDVRYIAYNIPYYEEVSGKLWSWRSEPGRFGVSYERGKAHRLLQEQLPAYGVELISTFEPFCAFEKPDTLYFARGVDLYDGHLSPTGNSVIARLIAEHITPRQD
jgi:hypothetical protein